MSRVSAKGGLQSFVNVSPRASFLLALRKATFFNGSQTSQEQMLFSLRAQLIWELFASRQQKWLMFCRFLVNYVRNLTCAFGKANIFNLPRFLCWRLFHGFTSSGKRLRPGTTNLFMLFLNLCTFFIQSVNLCSAKQWR